MRKVFIELKWVHFYFMLVVFSQCHLIKYEMVQLIFSAKNIALKANAVPFLVPTLSTTELLEQDSALFFWLAEFWLHLYSEDSELFFAKAIPSF